MIKSKQYSLYTLERGRSMVEMLGVLAVIGVLTVGGIYGYTFAMSKHKANEAASLVSVVKEEMDAAVAKGSQARMGTRFLKDSPVSVQDIGSKKKAGVVVDFKDDKSACRQFVKMYENNPHFAIGNFCEEK